MAKSKNVKIRQRKNFDHSRNSNDKMLEFRCFKGLKSKKSPKISAQEIKRFNALVKGHRKLLEVIGRL